MRNFNEISILEKFIYSKLSNLSEYNILIGIERLFHLNYEVYKKLRK